MPCDHPPHTPNATPMQVTIQNRPTHLNFFLSDSEDAPDDDKTAAARSNSRAYRQHFTHVMQGKTSLRPSMWVFLLCSGLTMLVYRPLNTGAAFTELRVRDAKLPGSRRTSQINLIRWLDRLRLPRSKGQPEVARLLQRADPNAEQFGCDRLVWARKGEPAGPKNMQGLSTKITNRAQQLKSIVKTAGPKRKKTHDENSIVAKARTALDKFGGDRLRADDAFYGVAYCAIAPPDQSATPVRVLPVIGTERENQWRPGGSSTSAVQRFRQFEVSQGYKLSSYYQLRLDLHAVPRGFEVEM